MNELTEGGTQLQRLDSRPMPMLSHASAMAQYWISLPNDLQSPAPQAAAGTAAPLPPVASLGAPAEQASAVGKHAITVYVQFKEKPRGHRSTTSATSSARCWTAALTR